MIAEYLIQHCSPTLATLKSANLMGVRYADKQELDEQIAYWNHELAAKGVNILTLKQKPGWALLYVYRKKYIQRRLEDPTVADFLREYGYTSFNIDAALDRLIIRLSQGDDFPHEIGIFLDYPLEDVQGFIENGGCNYKCNGCWKVYSNVCEALKLFQKYNKCREVYMRLWSAGRSVQKLTVAV